MRPRFGEVSDRELAQILASLRYCQEKQEELAGMPQFTSEGCVPLSVIDIDELCDTINVFGLRWDDGLIP